MIKRKNKRLTIGLLVDSYDYEYQILVWAGIESAARKADVNIISFVGGKLQHLDKVQDSRNAVYDLISSENIDGLIIFSSTLCTFISPDDLSGYCRKFESVPMVSIGIKLKGITSICVDNQNGFKELVNHLVEIHGYKKFLFIGGPDDNFENNERFSAFNQTLKNHGIPVNPDLIKTGNFHHDSAYDIVNEVIDKKIEIDAIVAANDSMAIGAMKALQERKIMVPDQIAVSGYDNIKSADFLLSPLTTVNKPLFEMAEKAIEFLLKKIQDKKVPDVEIMKTRLVIRRSCGCYPDELPRSPLFRIKNNSAAGIKNDFKHLTASVLQELRKNYAVDFMRCDQNLFSAILDGFYKVIVDGKEDKVFLGILDNALKQSSLENVDDRIWDGLITLLRKLTSPYFANRPDDTLMKMEDLFHKSRILIKETAKHVQANVITRNSEKTRTLQQVIRSLINSFEIPVLLEKMALELPGIGVTSCYLSLPSSNENKTVKEARLVLAYNRDGRMELDNDGYHFPAVQLFPRDRVILEDRYNLMIESLVFEKEQLGFIVMELNPLEGILITTMSDQIRSTIKASILLQETIKKDIAIENALNELKKNHIELEQINDRLKENDRLKDDFTANITYEFRTPLTLILGHVESMMSKDGGNEQMKIVYYNGMKLLKLINDLLDFTKIDSHMMHANKKNVNLAKLLKFYVSSVKSNAENAGLSIVFNNNTNMPSPGFIANIDTELFEKAIFNLISNALKFTAPGGEIIIQLDCDDQSFTVSVKDTGIGIPEDKLDAIFGRFVQLEDSESRKYEGTGIGLALTKEIVESMGGKISVKSKLNIGSIFSVTLPHNKDEILENVQDAVEIYELKNTANGGLDSCDEENGINAADHPDKSKSRKILIVEDNADMRKYLKSILEKEHCIIFANNGIEGLAMNEKEKPDLILADVMMPKMDGYEMTEQIKLSGSYDDIPVILLTAKTDISMKIKGFGKGAVDYITKPFNADELVVRINAHLEMKDIRDRISEQKAHIQNALDEKSSVLKLLEQSESKLREMIDFLPVAVIEEDMNQNITYMNNYARSLLKINEPSNGKKMTDFFAESSGMNFTARMNKMDKNNNLELGEYEILPSGGGKFKALIKTVPCFNKNKMAFFRHTVIEIQPNLNLTILANNDFYMKYHVSDREKEILIYMLQGYRNKDIGEKIFLSEAGVKKHISNIYVKTNVKNRSELLKLITENI